MTSRDGRPGLYGSHWHERELTCAGCGHRAGYRLPAVVDWRDRAAVTGLLACCPEVPCAACGRGIPPDVPVLVLRPGDPVPLMAGFPGHTALEDDVRALADLVRLAGAPGRATGQGTPFPVRMEHLPALIARYTGFALAAPGLAGDDGWAEPDLAWLRQVRLIIPVPDVAAALGRFLRSPDASAGRDVVRDNPCLTDPAWEPVVTELGEQTAAAQPGDESKAIIRSRLMMLVQLRHPVPSLVSGADLPGQARDLLRRATVPGAPLRARMTALAELAEILQADPSHLPIRVAALMSLQATVHLSGERSAEDMERAVQAGLAAAELAREAFGPEHAYTLTALSDTGALLADRQGADPAGDRELAIRLLEEAAAIAVATGSRRLGDILVNLAGAYSHRLIAGRADNRERAERLFEDALHVYQVLSPHDRVSAARARLNHAAALRERLTGNRLDATRRAVSLYARVLDGGPDALLALGPVDSIQVLANRASALFQLRELAPAEAGLAQVTAAVSAAAAGCDRLSPGDQVRLAVLTNSGAMLGDLYQEGFGGGRADAALLAEATALTGRAWQEAIDTLPSGHHERVRIGLNHAANLGRPDPEGQLGGAVHARRLLAELAAEATTAELHEHVQKIAGNLGRLAFASGDWADAATRYQQAIQAGARAYRDARTRPAQLAELAMAADHLGRLCVAHLLSDAPASAIEAIERSRARLLADALGADLREEDGAAATPVLYAGIGPRSWLILDVPGQPPHGMITGLTGRELRGVIASLRAARAPEQVRAALDALADALREPITYPGYLLLGELAGSGVADVQVVACGLLSGLPLHALPALPGGTARWADRAVVRYVPSRRVAAAIAGKPVSGRPPAVLAVADPSTRYSRHDEKIIDRWLGPPLIPPAGAARHGWVLGALTQASHLHAGLHGRFDGDDPLDSSIEIGGPRPLRLAEVLELNGLDLELAVLKCCSTGVTTEAICDELAGFGSALLAAGARRAVVSCWDISDLASTLLAAALYRAIGQGADPARALRTAQLWTAGLTNRDLAGLAGQARPGVAGALLPAGLAAEVRALPAGADPRFRDPDARPFDHVMYWGGLTYHGP